jgi:hypothetical protein
MTSASTVTVNGSGNRSPVKEKEKEMEKEKEETQQADHSPSRFTAVNGRDANMAGTNGNGHPGLVNGSGGGSGSGNENGGGNGNGSDERPDSRDAAKASFPDHDHDHARGTAHDAPPETANGSFPPYPHPPQHQHPPPPPPPEHSSHRSTTDEREPGHSSTSQLPSRMSSSPHKRKRSYSQDRHQISTPTSFHRHSLPKSPPSSNYPRLDDENDDRTSSNGTWNGEYDTGGPNHTPNRHSLDASDAQLAEALQRNNQEQDARQQNGWPIRHEDETGPDSQHFANYASDQRSSQGAQVGPKRKRVFSNRTKTGCMTCRRRKKKCDEGQPQCMDILPFQGRPILCCTDCEYRQQLHPRRLHLRRVHVSKHLAKAVKRERTHSSAIEGWLPGNTWPAPHNPRNESGPHPPTFNAPSRWIEHPTHPRR